MRLLICAGGTGGGVYPALSILQPEVNKLQSNIDSDEESSSKTADIPFDILWIGGQGGIETQLVERAGISLRSIPAAGIHGVGLKNLPGNLIKIFQGILEAHKSINQFKPDVAFFTGGYISVPVAIAAAFNHIPSIVYVPDIEPGMALKFVARFADCIALTVETSRQYFTSDSRYKDPSYDSDDRFFITGYPTRPDLEKWDHDSAKAALGLDDDKPIILVFGGSKGARSINRALISILPQLLEHAQIIHIGGELDWLEIESAQAKLPESLEKFYHPYPYLHEKIGAAFRCADLVVSRAGAAILGEYPLMGLPAILVPYPYAWRYQYINASYLEAQGAAQILRDEHLQDQLLSTILNLIREPQKLDQMRLAMKKIHRPGAALKLLSLINELGTKKNISDIKKGSLWSI